MSNFKDFIENKCDFLRQDYLEELKGKEVAKVDNYPIYTLYKERIYTASKNGIDKEAISYANVSDNKWIFAIDRKTKRIVFKNNVGDIKVEGYSIYFLDDILKEYNKTISYMLDKLSSKLGINLLVEMGYDINSMTLECFNKSSEDYYDKVIYGFLKDYKKEDIKEDIESYTKGIKIGTHYCDCRIIEMLRMMELSLQDRYNIILKGKNEIIRTLTDYSGKRLLRNIYANKLIEMAIEELGDLNENPKVKEYVKIVKALDLAGKTVSINEYKVEKTISYIDSYGYRDCSSYIFVGGIEIDKINTIKFRNKILYQKEA